MLKKKYLSKGLCPFVLLFSFAFQGNIVQAANSSVALTADEVTITNNVGKPDTIYVTGVTSGDVITAYSAATGGKTIGKAKVSGNNTSAQISVSQLGTDAGAVYLTVTSTGLTESNRTEVDYSAEAVSDAPSADNITIKNNAGQAATIYVDGLGSGDTVKLYTAATGGKLLSSATVGSNKTDVTLSLDHLQAAGGSLYVSVTSKGMHESSRVKADYLAQVQSDAPDASNVIITNNVGKADSIYVGGLAQGDIVKLYTAASGGKLLSSATVGSNKTDVTLSISQLGSAAGSTYISVTSKGMTESNRTQVSYSAEGYSNLVSTSNVTITNNVGKADTIYITGLISGDKIKVYNTGSGGSVIGSATAASDGTATVSIGQLGTSAGSVYISDTSTGMLESSRVQVAYSAESTTTALDASNIVVTNNVGASDTVQVSGVYSGEVINVYDSAKGGNLLGTVTVASGATSVTVSINQLGTSAGNVYVSLLDTNKIESARVQVAYSAEVKTSSVSADDVVVTNNSGKADAVYVSNLNAGDIVKVYDSSSGGNLLGTVTVASGATFGTVSINQLGTSAGSVYVSRTGTNKSESDRVQVDYSAESTTTALDASNIVVANNAGGTDTVQVSGVSAGEVINVYDSAKGGNLLGTATVASGATSVTVTTSELSALGGSIYVSLTDSNKLESTRVQVAYSAEAVSDTIDASNVSITNNCGTADTISLTGLSQNDIIKVYDSAQGGNLLGTATVAAGTTKTTISIAQLGTSAGNVYISRISTNKTESARVKVDYSDEPISSAPSASNIIVTNNAGIVDTVQLTGLSPNDVVNVYDSAQGGTLLGTSTVGSTGIGTTVSIPQLGSTAGSIFVSVTSTNKDESARTQVGFAAEAKSTAPESSNITTVNNAGIAGTVTVNGLSGADVVNVYDSAQGGTLLGTSTVGTYGTTATISVAKLAAAGGNIYVSVTSAGKLESTRTEAAYSAELVSNTPDASNITVVNNSGTASTVTVLNLQPNDIVNIYDSAQGGSLLGTATVASTDVKVTVSTTQLKASGGTIYVSVTSTGKTESSRTAVQYNAQSQSAALTSGDIVIANNSGASDTIIVTGVANNDVINVYSAATGGMLLGTATVSGDSGTVITVPQLGAAAGSVYVSVVRYGMTESTRTEADYAAESTAPVVGNIAIVNNAVIADTITVKGLTANDVVKVYDAATGGNLLGYADVSAGSDIATITIPQLSTGAGSVYISVMNFGKSESSRTKADYIAEQSSTPLYAGNINITNNPSGTSDVITVNNLLPYDYIKVYDAASGGNLIGSATASSSGTQVTINITQLGTSAGSVYISVTNYGKDESSRTKADYTAEN
jgi:hypothetical protein